MISAPQETLSVTVYPDGVISVPFESYDIFKPNLHDSFPLAYVERNNQPHRATFALYAPPNEKTAGTGERFAPMNLSGKTLSLENF